MADLTYPRHVHQRGGVYVVVTNADELARALELGCQLQPDPSWPVPNWPNVYREVSLDDPRLGDPAPDPVPARKKPGPKPKAGPKPSESSD